MKLVQIILLSYPDYSKLGRTYFFTFRVQNNFIPIPLMYYVVTFDNVRFSEGPIFFPIGEKYKDVTIYNIAGKKGKFTYVIKVGLLPGPTPIPTLDSKKIEIEVI